MKITTAFGARDPLQKANTVPIPVIADKYGLHLSASSPKICCPFPAHSGGNERTPSFYYYERTNSYHCFGCKAGSTPVDFVANIEEISKPEAAKKIMSLFSDSASDEFHIDKSYGEKKKLLFQFSNRLRQAIHLDKSPDNIDRVEKIAKVLDDLKEKYEDRSSRKILSLQAMQKIIARLTQALEDVNVY
jgi:hypothetical protein